MTTYSGRHEDDDRLSTNWKHQKMKKYTLRKIDSVVSESGYSSSNSKEDFLLSDQTNQSTSHFLTSYTQDSDTGTDDVAENSTEYKTTLSEKEFQTDTPKNQNGSVTTRDIKQLESNNCETVKLNTIQQSTSIQSSPKEQLKLTNSAHIKLNRLSSGEDEQRKQKRFNRTAKALRDSGLLPIAIQTGHLLKKNLMLQKEIDKLKKEAELFFKSLGSEDNVPENISSDSSSSD